MDEAKHQLTAVTTARDELSAELAQSSAERESLSQQVRNSESRRTELENQLESLTQQLSASQAKSSGLSDKLRTASQGLSSSETRVTELEAELEEEHAARSRLESELNVLSQQPAGRGAGDESPSGSPARKAEAGQEELQDLRSALSASASVFCLFFCPFSIQRTAHCTVSHALCPETTVASYFMMSLDKAAVSKSVQAPKAGACPNSCDQSML